MYQMKAAAIAAAQAANCSKNQYATQTAQFKSYLPNTAKASQLPTQSILAGSKSVSN